MRDAKPGRLKVAYRPIEELIPYARNSRTHSDAQVAQIAASIREFGWTNPVLVDGERGIIAGHGRVMAARKLGLDEVPTIELAHLTDTQRRAYVLADNQLALNAGWDEALLAVELKELADAGFDLPVVGFADDDIARLLGSLEEPAEPWADQDDAPPAPEEPVSRPGDVWLLGSHRLMCGDSTDAGAVSILIAGGHADLLFTDPPYGVAHNRRGRSSRRAWRPIAGDEDQTDDDNARERLGSLLARALGNAAAACKEGAAWYVWYGYLQGGAFYHAIESAGRTVAAEIVWRKNALAGGFAHYRSRHEPCLYVSGQFYGGRDQDTVWDIDRETDYVHPTQKPVALVERALTNSSKAGDIVLDLFGGSGSTLIGCEKLGRHARLMELEPAYCDVIVQRWQLYTGKLARLEDTGQHFAGVAEARGVEVKPIELKGRKRPS